MCLPIGTQWQFLDSPFTRIKTVLLADSPFGTQSPSLVKQLCHIGSDPGRYHCISCISQFLRSSGLLADLSLTPAPCAMNPEMEQWSCPGGVRWRHLRSGAGGTLRVASPLHFRVHEKLDHVANSSLNRAGKKSKHSPGGSRIGRTQVGWTSLLAFYWS